MCPILWAIIDETFGLPIGPSILHRLNLSNPPPQTAVMLTAAYNMYHTIQIGHHDLVLRALASGRFGEIYKNAKLVAKEFQSQFPGVTSSGIFTAAPRVSRSLSDDPLLVEVAPGVFMRVNSSASPFNSLFEYNADLMDG